MPTTFISLLIFAAMLVPGIVYAWANESYLPKPRQSAFRETATVAFASFASWAVVLALFSILRRLRPTITLDAGQLAREPGAYAVHNLAPLVEWSFGLLLAATVLAFSFGRFKTPIAFAIGNLPGFNKILPNPQNHSRFQSEWYTVFKRDESLEVHVKVSLDDGSMVAGKLGSYNWSTDEAGDRDLTLDRPITHRPSLGDVGGADFNDAQSVIISARRIMAIGVYYCPKGPRE